MLAPRWRKVLRDIWSAKTRTALVVLSIAVGVFAFGTIVGARDIVNRELNRSFLAIDPASATFTLDAFDQDLVDAIARRPDIAAAQGRQVLSARVRTGPETFQQIQIIAIPDVPMTVNRLESEQGAWPPPPKTILLERTAPPLFDVAVGDTVLLDLPQGSDRAIPISGVVHDNTAPPAGVNGTGYGYVALDTLPWLGQPRSFTQLQIRVAENPNSEAAIRAVARDVEQQLRDAGHTVQQIDIPTPLEPPTAQLLPTILMLLIFLGVLALVLSAFLIINTITAILTQQTRQIGVMKAIGANTRQILALYLTMALLFGLVAVSFAVPLSMLAAYGFASFLAVTLNFDIASAAISPTIIAIEVAAGMLVPVAAGIVPIMSAARQSVRAALDAASGPTAGPTATEGWRAQLGQAWGAISSFALRLLRLSRPLLLSLRNTFRRRGRLVRTLSALTLAGAMFIATQIVDASVTRSLTESFASRRYDVSVTFPEAQLAARVEPLAVQVPGVASVETWQRTTGRPVRAGNELGDELNLTALPPDTTLLAPEIVSGRWLLPEDERAIVVSANFLTAKEPALQVGDSFTLTVSRAGARWQDELSAWRIVGVSQEFAGPAQPAEVYVPLAALERAHGSAGLGQILRVRLTAAGRAAPEQAAAALAAQFAAQDIRVSEVETSGEQLEQVLTTFGIVSTVLSAMALLMGLVGGLGLTGTMSINVLERTREIGVLRAVGAANGAIYQIIISEGLIIGMFAWVLGVVLSIPLGLILCTAMGAAMLNTPLTFTFSWAGVGIWLLLVLMVASLASFSPARNAVRLTVREVLAYDG